MAPTESELKTKAEHAAEAAKSFSDIFYDFFDKKRHAVKNLYLDSANLVWNGRAMSGKDAIVKFLEDLPSSETTLSSLDSHPVNESASENQTTIMVTTMGRIQFQDSKPKSFYQTFLLSSNSDNVWKIVSDTYRFMEAPPSSAGL